MNAAFKAHKAHFGAISQAMIDYVENHVLLRSRYLFAKTVMRVQFAYCTHCKRNHRPEESLKHDQRAICPHCKSECRVRKSHVGRKYLIDRAYVVFYEKSVIDPSIMTAVGFFVQRDYTGSYEDVQTKFNPSCSYVFQMGGSTMFYANYYGDTEWYQRENIVSEYSMYKNGTPCYHSADSIKAAIIGTPMQYSTWENYCDGSDMTKFFGLYTKYPCIEYLTKLNYEYFVWAKLNDMRTYDAIKWSGKTIEEVLRLHKKDLKQFMSNKPKILEMDSVGALTLRLYQLTLKDSNRPDFEELKRIASSVYSYFAQMKPMFKFQNVRACARYIEKQFNKNRRVFYDRSSVVTMWKDYMDECRTLGFDLTRMETVFPHNLASAHESTMSQVKIQMSEIEKQRISKRAQELEVYRFAWRDYIIRPAQSGQEIIDEGKILSHCVGGYAQRHATGETSILMIRKYADQDTPFFTMELKNGQVRQVYGFDNLRMSGDLIELIDAFKAEKLAKSKGKSKKSNKPQGVAV
ncbi:hypothetical protein A8L34_22390 [Bacillus sp. FJAT-27264]|uniref:PcfJ domain-containing protein n=1 Tax=Paenibacillus sp. (strain DSM 101736 / FJAT-27264) TaxID=1850362 RepID=UPI000807DCF7|nr:PcfJ domain-containing protein [Bacillus sp. FJAT-27264]OBZ08905.1 hypothetical protein A8L34_22390 [Bacillus sp. FJAT-27264]